MLLAPPDGGSRDLAITHSRVSTAETAMFQGGDHDQSVV
jgi:hypothetical protein